MEKPQIKTPQVEGLKNFLVQLPYQFADYEIRDLSSSMEFRRIAHAIKLCNKEQQQKNNNPSQSAEQYNYSCIARTICGKASRDFIQCWRQAQMNPNLTCETQRRSVETCVGEHISQAVYAVDSGSLSAACFDDETEEQWWRRVVGLLPTTSAAPPPMLSLNQSFPRSRKVSKVKPEDIDIGL